MRNFNGFSMGGGTAMGFQWEEEGGGVRNFNGFSMGSGTDIGFQWDEELKWVFNGRRREEG